MAWEYLYAFGQAQETLKDHLVTASLYGMRLTRPGYTDPRSRPAPPSAAETPATKEAACVAYVTDADISCSQEPTCKVATGKDGREAFICPEVCCEALKECHVTSPLSNNGLRAGTLSMSQWHR